ncbi:MAG: gamma-glutamyl-gamma-aminobutyrate hydrolase family protein, partial [Eggerthellaceae bacterium]|nr:gamma-glutamyl-gamma-aminobutyrate hydrolase family protein [Eggerthellaceae bacterium]
SRYGAARQPRTHRAALPRDEMEQVLINAAIEAGKPILGVCRGMQAINVARGGTLFQDITAAHPTTTVHHVQGRPFDMPAHMVEIVPDSKLAACVGALRLGVNTIHHQSVAALGKGLVVSAVSPDDGIVEGIEMPDAPFVVGVQWHPEHMWRIRPHSKRLVTAFVQAASEQRRSVAGPE